MSRRMDQRLDRIERLANLPGWDFQLVVSLSAITMGICCLFVRPVDIIIANVILFVVSFWRMGR